MRETELIKVGDSAYIWVSRVDIPEVGDTDRIVFLIELDGDLASRIEFVEIYSMCL